MLQVVRLKPNPSGKDRNSYGSPAAAQLGAEWVDIKNVGNYTENLSDVELKHVAFRGAEKKPEWEAIRVLPGTLAPGQILRVHSGEHRNIDVLRPEDLAGAEWHCFTGSDRYVWNNAEGDTAALWSLSKRQFIDKAGYSPNPPEGVILYRSGERLVPAGTAVYR